MSSIEVKEECFETEREMEIQLVGLDFFGGVVDTTEEFYAVKVY